MIYICHIFIACNRRARAYKLIDYKFKQRKMLDIKVPKLLNELHALCDKYQEHYGIDDILVDGLRADKYADRVVEEYERERDLHRVQKV